MFLMEELRREALIKERYAGMVVARCARPGCGATPTADQQLLRCARCKKTLYCGRGCQRSHWKAHKLECLPSNLVHKDESSSVRLALFNERFLPIFPDIAVVTLGANEEGMSLCDTHFIQMLLVDLGDDHEYPRFHVDAVNLVAFEDIQSAELRSKVAARRREVQSSYSGPLFTFYLLYDHDGVEAGMKGSMYIQFALDEDSLHTYLEYFEKTNLTPREQLDYFNEECGRWINWINAVAEGNRSLPSGAS